MGLFLDSWPPWAAASLVAAGLVALACRLAIPDAAPGLWRLWLAPLLSAVPVAIRCVFRAYRPAQVLAIADSLGGGSGVLLALAETHDAAWSRSALAERASRFALPRLRPWKRLAPIAPAAAFLAAALALPQRVPAGGSGALAADIAADLAATVTALKEEELITQPEEERLAEEIERIREGARRRVDAATWEAADALRERMSAGLAEKENAIAWAEESLARYTAAAASPSMPGDRAAAAQSGELKKALETLAQSGLLANAPESLRRMLKSGSLPLEPDAMKELAAALSKHLAEARGKLGGLGRMGKEFGRFNPDDFPLASQDGDHGRPGRGGIDRGRGDAPLTWGKETDRFDRFKASPLPPGAARSPDDWVPLVELPGAPEESAVGSSPAAARQYDPSAGQAAWRRTLAPRHQSAVKKYFQK
jgi:hypothetical protein